MTTLEDIRQEEDLGEPPRGIIMPDDTKVGPHGFTPLKWHDNFYKHGRCEACLLPLSMHPVTGYVPARYIGDDTRYHESDFRRTPWRAHQ